MSPKYTFFATTPKGIASVLYKELLSLDIEVVKEQPAGVIFQGSLEAAYRACLWSRTAGRILLPLAEFYAPTPEILYDEIYAIDWAEHLLPDGTLCVDFNTSQSKITHSHYGALKVKDSIVDFFRDLCGERPSVDTNMPDLRINLHLYRDQATVSIDLSGDSLHRRGYRQEKVTAPLKENLAAAILLRADWPSIAQQGGSLIDPMCGSATFLIEAAMMAADIAPGLSPNERQKHWGFSGWTNHDAQLWQTLFNDAEQRCQAGLEKKLPTMIGFDADRHAIHASLANIHAAGLQKHIHVEKQAIEKLMVPNQARTGLVIVNPPYGERLGDAEVLTELYRNLGETLKESFIGWQAAVLTGNPELSKRIGIRAKKMHPFFNGSLVCKLLRFDIHEDSFMNARPAIRPVADTATQEEWSEGARMFANRLKKNAKSLSRWIKQEQVHAYRLYDADMPEYALAVDLYTTNSEQWAHVQEYQAPKTIDETKAKKRLQEALSVLPATLGIANERIILKVRSRQRGKAQYELLADEKQFIRVQENNCQFLINLHDYIDTGLFLDHRITRQLFGDLAQGKRVLNLFAYTGSATVYAAKGGAKATTTVDLSKTYLQWAKKNMALNGFSESQHYYVQQDCLQWLDEEIKTNYRYGLIFLDPPTFSTSKRMQTNFDIQRDHVALIQKVCHLLTDDGTLIFSNNFRKFKLDKEALDQYTVEDLTQKTLPKDFSRNTKIHHCWKITRQSQNTPMSTQPQKENPWKTV